MGAGGGGGGGKAIQSTLAGGTRCRFSGGALSTRGVTSQWLSKIYGSAVTLHSLLWGGPKKVGSGVLLVGPFFFFFFFFSEWSQWWWWWWCVAWFRGIDR